MFGYKKVLGRFCQICLFGNYQVLLGTGIPKAFSFMCLGFKKFLVDSVRFVSLVIINFL